MSSPFWQQANPQLRELVSYEPGKPVEDLARELGIPPDDIIKLASNENPLGPSPKALAAMRAALDRAQLYPDGGGYYLREAIAEKFGLARENVILGNGSNEIIEFLGHAFLRPGDEVVTSDARLRRLPPDGAAFRRAHGRGARAARLRARPRRHAGRHHAAHPAGLHRQPEQPHRHDRHRRRRSSGSWRACPTA